MRAKKVLIVEDEPEITYLVRLMLEKAGFDAVEAGDAWEALRKLGEIKVDLVLLDIVLPGKSGWSLLEEMKKDERLKDIPVIVFTAKAEDDRDREYIQSYHLPVIRKPFDSEELIETVVHGAEYAEA